MVNLQLVFHERLSSAFLRCVICPVDFVPCECWLWSSHFHWTNMFHTRGRRCGCSPRPVSGLWVYLIKTMSSCLSWEMRERGRCRILNSHPACVSVTTFGSWRSWRMETARPEGVTCPRVRLPEGCAEEGAPNCPHLVQVQAEPGTGQNTPWTRGGLL